MMPGLWRSFCLSKFCLHNIVLRNAGRFLQFGSVCMENEEQGVEATGALAISLGLWEPAGTGSQELIMYLFSTLLSTDVMQVA